MSSFADRWRDADDEDWVPPAGTYKAVVIDASGWISRKGDETAKVRLQVTDGPHAGKAWDHMLFFNNPVGTRISKNNLSMYGLDVSSLSDWYEVEEAMPGLIGTRVEASVKHNDPFVNTDVLRSFTAESDVTKPEDAQLFEHAPAGNSARNAIDDDVPY